MDPLISICMAHYKRSDLLRRTLTSLKYQANKPPFEVVIVNDADNDLDLVNVCKIFKYDQEFGGNIRLFNTGRNYSFRGPAMPWNASVRQAVGKIILLQSPEVMHVGELLNGISKEVLARQGKPCYIATKCVESCQHDLLYLDTTCPGCYKDRSLLSHIAYPLRQEYCGPHMLNKQPLYFCAAMLKEHFVQLGGLSEDFAYLAFEDNEFVYRVQKNGFEIVTPYDADYYSVHLYHEKLGTCDKDRDFRMAVNNSCVVFNFLVNMVEQGQRPPIANIDREWGLLSENNEVIL